MSFDLPWLQFLQGWFLWLVLMSLAGAVLVYLASYSAERLTAKVQVVGVRQPWLRLPPAAERHLLVLGAVALGLIAWGYQLNIPSLLYSTSGRPTVQATPTSTPGCRCMTCSPASLLWGP